MHGTEYAELHAFVAVARERSFRRAATQLKLSPSALSHALRALEARLGAKLLNRTTRSVSLTEAGDALLRRIEPAFGEISGAVQAVKTLVGRPSGAIKLSVPRLAAHVVLAPRLGAFTRAHPGIQLEASVHDVAVDIVAKGFDAGIRLKERVQRDMVAVRVSDDLRAVLVASPKYLSLRPMPSSPRDLSQHRCINFREHHSGALARWQLERDGETLELLIDGPLTVDDHDLLITAALDGVGLACVTEISVQQHLTEGRLVRVLNDWCKSFPGFYLYFPKSRHVTPALRAFVDFIRLEQPA
ncbi:MAG: LysR family transcriptional regulator [Polyangiales bacterium]